MEIVAGQTYAGSDGSRRIVQSVRGGDVTYRQKMSGRIATCTVAEFEAWLDLQADEAPDA